ncbi:hypothetical protein P3T23_009194, partial [Paraburkholderia sp. GAS448]|uniref:hypothetical protein n=1 Tax=Paraburkholderia sp. GAS448 TaxID=3035136 RepID=UPI003D1B452C
MFVAADQVQIIQACSPSAGDRPSTDARIRIPRGLVSVVSFLTVCSASTRAIDVTASRQSAPGRFMPFSYLLRSAIDRGLRRTGFGPECVKTHFWSAKILHPIAEDEQDEAVRSRR